MIDDSRSISDTFRIVRMMIWPACILKFITAVISFMIQAPEVMPQLEASLTIIILTTVEMSFMIDIFK
jgi:hypothetical protein